VCDISGYGDDPQHRGPYRDKKAYDLLIQSESGFLCVTGTPTDMVKAGCSIADIAAGMYAYSNILAALIERGKTGAGCRLDISMLESMTEWMSFPLYYAFEGAPAPPRSGAAHATIYPYGPFPTGDGKTVMLGLQNEREWHTFCDKVLGCPKLATDPRFASNTLRVQARDLLRELIVDAFAPYTAEQIMQRLEHAQIANATARSMQDVWNHPQLAARERWTQINTSEGKIPALLPPGIPTEWEPRMDAVPALGQHTDAILAEIGYDQAAINALHADGVV
jgi:itaconate CoA-transferase